MERNIIWSKEILSLVIIEWIISVVLCMLSLAGIITNYFILKHNIFNKHDYVSWMPLFFGIIGTIGLWLIPYKLFHHLWYLPIILDPSSTTTIYGVIWRTLKHFNLIN